MELGIVYCAYCISNGKRYIGQTKNGLDWRIKRHYKDIKINKTKFQRALLKYGKNNFIWKIIQECNFDVLDDIEIYWIKYYDTYINGYNSTLGGKSGKVTHCRKFSLMSPSGEIYELENISKFCREYNLIPSEISSVLSGRCKSHREWKLPETKYIGTLAKIKAKEKEFILVSPTGETVSGKNRAEFCRKEKISPGNLSMLINGKPNFNSVKGWTLSI
jgi:group I intron endonuclease